MQLICINTWGGKEFDALLSFVQAHASRTDIFCFQEIFSGPSYVPQKQGMRFQLLSELQSVLSDYACVFDPLLDAGALSGSAEVTSGNAIFVRRSIPIIEHGSFFAFGKKYEYIHGHAHNASLVQHVTLSYNGVRYRICNVHGIAVWPKSDTPERIEQVSRILDFVKREPCPHIVCGDFNLFQNTESVRMLRGFLRDLTQEFAIPTTRSEIVYRIRGRGSDVDRVSDYAFVSPQIKVLGFEVPNVEISDHLPLVLRYTIEDMK